MKPEMTNVLRSRLAYCRLAFAGRYKIFCLIFTLFTSISYAQKLPEGFTDHGVTSAISNHRGIVATKDKDGNNIVLTWLYDHRGGYELLLIDAKTGKTEEFPMPFDIGGDGPFASILSSKNRFYTHFNGHFVEFDPLRKAFTFHSKTMMQMAMGMTEDDNGVIWTVTYPNSGVVGYNPATGEFTDYGYVYKQNWPQYQRCVATDDRGWLYFGVGETASQIVAFNPADRQIKIVLEERDRQHGSAYLYRDRNGKVYGQPAKGEDDKWMELYDGQVRMIGKLDERNPKLYNSGTQGLFKREFPNGDKIKELDLTSKKLVVVDSTGRNEKSVSFTYSTEGAWTLGAMALADGRIVGGTSFPMRLYTFDPALSKWTDHYINAQLNSMTQHGNTVFFGSYPGGYLLEWNTKVPTISDSFNSARRDLNPRRVLVAEPSIHRPHRIITLHKGNTVVMAGTPAYGYTGGGLVFWNRKTNAQTSLSDTAVALDQSTMSLVALADGKILGGTTTEAGTGGQKKAAEAELYLIDPVKKKVSWRERLIKGAQVYSDLYVNKKGLVYGVADWTIFFVFNPKTKKMVYKKDLSAEFGTTTSEQSPRNLIKGEKGKVYLLFVKGIAEINSNFSVKWVQKVPFDITAGGDYSKGRLYFIAGSRLFSYKIQK